MGQLLQRAAELSFDYPSVWVIEAVKKTVRWLRIKILFWGFVIVMIIEEEVG